MKKLIILFVIIFCFGCFAITHSKIIFAENVYFDIVDEYNNYISSKSNVQIGDNFINQNGLYEIIDIVGNKAIASFICSVELPNVKRTNVISISQLEQNKTIGLYSTHNDESYISGDGYSSIYGNGGICDVRDSLAKELKNLGINIINSNQSHIPHDNLAYSRSSYTASDLLEQNSTAIFDIHRDAGARSSYVVNSNGKDFCQVRIVIGKANENYQSNLEFALYLFDVAQNISPNLFLDIYLAKGHYNQSLSSKCLLFEIGTEQVEKSLASDSTKELANVINTTLFKTSVDITGELDISPVDTKNSINTMLENSDKSVTTNNQSTILIIIITIASIGAYIFYLSNLRQKQ